MQWMIVGLLSVGILAVLYFFLFSLSKNKIIFTMIKEGEIEYAMRGESLRKIIVNVKGYGVKKNRISAKIGGKDILIDAYKVCPASEGGIPSRFLFGMAWVGLFYPYEKILGYSLYFRYTYQIVIKNLKLKGRYPIDVSFNVIIEAVYPEIPVLYLKGRWLQTFQAKFWGFITDSVRCMEPDEFEKQEKSKFFENYILEKQDSFIEETGMKPVAIIYRGYKASGTAEEKEAFSKKKVAELNREATVINADATGKTIEREGEARKEALLDILTAAKSHEDGAEILKKQLESEAIGNFKGQFLNYGGGGQGPSVSINVSDLDKNKKNKQKRDKK